LGCSTRVGGLEFSINVFQSRKAVCFTEVRMRQQERWQKLLLCLVLLLAVLLPAAQKQDKPTGSERNPVEGAKIFQYRCAMCHGTDGRGHGPDSVVLRHPVADLTLISQRSGGKFPYQCVKEIIEGTKNGMRSQGDREMPVWGPIFHEVDADQDWGEVRMDAITKYVESIQQK
jgi:mono/diheme cytochrome c family protein